MITRSWAISMALRSLIRLNFGIRVVLLSLSVFNLVENISLWTAMNKTASQSRLR